MISKRRGEEGVVKRGAGKDTLHFGVRVQMAGQNGPLDVERVLISKIWGSGELWEGRMEARGGRVFLEARRGTGDARNA